MISIALENVSKSYQADTPVVKNVDLDIEPGEFVVIVGPSGCGKSTMMRMIAGLERISSGTLRIGGKVANDIPPQHRDIAMVFQNYALYPHLTVAENIGFSLEMRGVSKTERLRRVEVVAHLLQLSDYLHKKPKDLSGGQRQRVAMGRAIARDAKTYLMDEPLSNLDAELRSSMRAEIKHLHRQLKATMIYVTHDQVEALTLADRIAVMNKGVLLQFDTPEKIYDDPASLFVAGFIGSPPMNFIEANCKEGIVQTTKEGTRIPITCPPELEGEDVVVGLRPENGVLSAGDKRMAIEFRGEVMLIETTGSNRNIHAKTATGPLLIVAPRSAAIGLGDNVSIGYNTEDAFLFEKKTGKRIHLS
ncbi:sn-glycerol 3-phosphate transport system ATP-binding protein/multiple sugar transport system ATP-binding protein [Phyllobacterium trifolii]|uniref:sn-glycerol 3-phosphate transport system ATP-binding protein/multiple sugar transport system ATP-binding protein n=1 Tax=Phyllobacterium trifolii TaxID=300193 RepID=A0A839UCU1_9HYPH|nr:sn-glycerol-3-phosphate ABC transporter ATP-binding protein UgpC [Phyllobacterium trifolii]MBB3147663.1 sn-glycerol 3-phosphate transport system ATP-binding protein/multiple sugar transport system ATP-binding protein [Phyllobacterium trifolii]